MKKAEISRAMLAAATLAFLALTPGTAMLIAPAATAQQGDVHPDELRKRANAGDIAAIRTLQQSAIWYKNPKRKNDPQQRIEFSQDERLKWIRAGAAMDDPYSLERLARIYGKGTSVGGGYAVDNFSALVPLDYAESARLARAAAAGFRRHKDEFKYTGIGGGERLLERAAAQEVFAQQSDDLSVLLPLADAGDKEALWGVYLVHSVANNYPDIWDWLAKSVKAGDPRAIVETWRRTSWQSNYKAWDNGKPNDWLMMAARLNDPTAMEGLANAYAWYAKDDAKALEWYRKAHEAGANFSEAGMYLYGDANALRLMKAAESGDGAAAYRLARYYLTGDWDGRSTAEYERWMHKAVELRNTEARYEWGKHTGDAALIEAAANAGHAGAKAELARLRVIAAADAAQAAAQLRREQRAFAESVFTVLRGSGDYAKNGLSPEGLHAALQAAETDGERQLIADENARRVANHRQEINSASGYRPVQVTPYVPKPTYKTASDFAREHREFKEHLVARLREVVR